MRIIKPTRIREYWRRNRRAKLSLQRWLALASQADWSDIQNVRATFASADAVTVRSGRTVTIFNIAGNAYRLITAIHYNTGKVFVLRFLTHAEYEKDAWKDQL